MRLRVSGESWPRHRRRQLHPPVRVDFEFRGLHARLRRILQRTRLLGAVAAHFPNQHARDPDAVGCYVPNFLALPDLSRTTIDGFIGVFVGRGASAPLEETDKVAADLEVARPAASRSGPRESSSLSKASWVSVHF